MHSSRRSHRVAVLLLAHSGWGTMSQACSTKPGYREKYRDALRIQVLYPGSVALLCLIALHQRRIQLLELEGLNLVPYISSLSRQPCFGPTACIIRLEIGPI
jgi:hypothetical protein